MLNYPVRLIPDDNDTIMVEFVDVPGARSYGGTEQEALFNAVDALETTLSALIADRKDIPFPSDTRGDGRVAPTLLGMLKIAVYLAMRARGWRKADLARALEMNPRQVDRLLDLRHGSTVGQLDRALRACGQRAEIVTRRLEAA
jgi:antitoxin HicB